MLQRSFALSHRPRREYYLPKGLFRIRFFDVFYWMNLKLFPRGSRTGDLEGFRMDIEIEMWCNTTQPDRGAGDTNSSVEHE